jgi:hypothetical protein
MKPQTSVDFEQTTLLIQRAAHSFRPTVEYISIDHRGFDIFMPKQYLNDTDITSFLQQVGCKAVTKGFEDLHESSMDRIINISRLWVSKIFLDITTKSAIYTDVFRI